MALPDMADTLREWEQPVPLKSVVQRTVDFVPADIVTVSTVLAVVQPADKHKLDMDTLDWSRSYLMVHSRFPLAIGKFVEWQGGDYKIVEAENYGEYGYWEAVAEETKTALLVEPEPEPEPEP